MSWTHRPMPKWLLILPLLLSTTLTHATDTATPSTRSDQQSMISIDACAQTCDLEIAEALKQCPQQATPQVSSQSVIDTCESDCGSELQALTEKLESECDGSVTKAVADERRHYEPALADMTAERDRWRQGAEDAIRAADIWRDVAIGAGVLALVMLVVTIAL